MSAVLFPLFRHTVAAEAGSSVSYPSSPLGSSSEPADGVPVQALA